MAYNLDKGVCYTNGEISLVIIPKNASTTLRKSLNLKERFNIITDKSKDYGRLFCVIREPFDRLVSGYLEVIARAEIDSPLTIEKKFYNMEESKARFVEFINEIKVNFFDAHIEPQTFYLTDNYGNDVPVDDILMFENLSSDIKKIVDVPLSNLNKKNTEDKVMVHNYINGDDKLIRDIKEIYKEDFILYEKYRS